jgi:hypothetical protein
LDVNGIGNFASNVQAKGFVGYRIDNGVGLEVNGGDLGNGTFIAKFNNYSNVTKVAITGSGNVGIGTISPTSGYMLDVVGSILSRVASGNTSFVVQTNNANGALNAIAGTGLELATDGTNQNIVFRTGSSEKMRITSGGNIGIGTSSPTIYGGGMEISRASQAALRVSSTGGTSPGGIEIGYESSVGGFIQTVQAGGQITFYTGNASTTAMRITSAGNIGIGTTSPNLTTGNRTTVDINGISNSLLVFSNGGSYKGYIYNGGVDMDYTSVNQALFGAGTNVLINTAGVERMRITSGGSVGIGYTAPGTKLQVNGAISSYNGEALLQNNTWTTVATFSNDDIMSGTFTYYVAGTNNSLICSFIKNWNGGSSQLYIGNTLASNGSVAIRVSGNSIQILQAFGVALYGYWTMQRIM